MAQLPGGEWLVQSIGSDVVVINRYTEKIIVRFDATDASACARAQGDIYACEQLDEEQKAFAHFWCGYFYAYLAGPRRPGGGG